MLVFAILLGVFAVLHVPPLGRLEPLRTRRDKAAWALAAVFFFTGTDHFLNPERYMVMMPAYLPWPLALIYISGFLELAGAAGLLIRRLRRWAAFGLVALLLAVFQANVYVALEGISVPGLTEARWYYWLRLPLQFLLIGWAVWSARSEKPRGQFSSQTN